MANDNEKTVPEVSDYRKPARAGNDAGPLVAVISRAKRAHRKRRDQRSLAGVVLSEATLLTVHATREALHDVQDTDHRSLYLNRLLRQ